MHSLYLLSVCALIAGVASNSSEDGSLDIEGEKSTNCSCGWRGQVDDKIIGGSLAGDGEFPSQIRLYVYYNNELHDQCGGTILTEQWILLAAHCIRLSQNGMEGWIDPYFLRIAYGVADTTDLQESDTLEVEKYHYFDPDYNTTWVGRSDVTLLKVKEPFEFGPGVGPACFPSDEEPMEPYVDKDVIAIGYGYTQWDTTDNPVTTDKLHKVHLDRQWDLEFCNKYIKSDVYNDELICTFTPGKSMCRGDSGGPLFFYDKEIERYVIVGVASFADAPGEDKKGCTIAGFTKVGYYRDWILETMSDEGESMCMKQDDDDGDEMLL